MSNFISDNAPPSITLLKQYNLVLIRYNEIWLKSTKVKIRMLQTLMSNIKNMLKRSGIPFTKYQLSKDANRIFYFFKNENLPDALELLGKVFGIHSFSPALRTSNKLDNIMDKVVEVGKEILEKNDTFAIRAKRSGKHDFSSQDVARGAGKVILENFPDLELKVNLSSPKKKIFIEVRGDFSYVYTDIIKNKWGGLPIETQKKILTMDVGRLNDLLGGFLLMRRGAEIYPAIFCLTEDESEMKKHLSNWKKAAQFSSNFSFTIKLINLNKIIKEVSESLKENSQLCSICRLIRLNIISLLLKESKFSNLKSIRAISDGVSLNNMTLCTDMVDLESIAYNYLFSEHPVFTPIIGLKNNDIDEFLSKIAKDLKKIDYCQFKPENQVLIPENLEELYNSLNLGDLISESIENIKEVNLLKKV